MSEENNTVDLNDKDLNLITDRKQFVIYADRLMYAHCPFCNDEMYFDPSEIGWAARVGLQIGRCTCGATAHAKTSSSLDFKKGNDVKETSLIDY